MKLKDIKDVLTFASFRPEPDDTTAGWPKRFPRERTLMLNITKTGVSWVGMERGLKIGDSGSLEGAVKDVAGQVGDEWKSLTDDGWCAVSLSTRYVISLESNLSRRKGAEEQIRTNPKIALGAKAERGKRYSVAHNSESNTSVLLAVEEDLIKRIETSLDSAGLKVGRVSCGPFSMLTDLIEQVAEARAAQKEGEGLGPIVMVACCQGSVVALTQQGDNWTELRSRTDAYEGSDATPVLGIIQPLIENAGDGTHVVFMGDEPGLPLPALLQERLPNVRVSDVSVENQLWKKLADL